MKIGIIRMLIALMASLSSIIQIQAKDNSYDEKVSNAFDLIFHLNPVSIIGDKCFSTATADFEKYISKIDVIRDAWLNRDYSVDFYNQRRKQIFSYVVVKRFGELMTEHLYNPLISKNPPKECFFSISVKTKDKFGKEANILISTWSFNEKQSNKIDWLKFDPRDFHEVAINYQFSPQVESWLSDEPPSDDTNSNSTANSNCDIKFIKANATFIRSTAMCDHNFLDTPSGYYALAMTRQCKNLSYEEMTNIAITAMKEFDAIIKRNGLKAACQSVADLENAISQYVVKGRAEK